jgi:HSP20 family protein
MFDKQSDKYSLAIDEIVGNDAFSINDALRPAPADWSEQEAEGQLSVDVGQDDENLIIVATMAGALAEDIELHLHNDLLTIRGARRSPLEASSQRFYEECYWGKFSRTIVLPVDVKGELAQAQYKNGVLTIRLPKARANEEIPIMVIEE